MKTTVLTFEYEDGVLEHLTSQAPEDGSAIELISWGSHVWKRSADGRYRIASIWVPDREKFDSTIFDSEDVEAMKDRATRHAVESARLSATEIATAVAEEIHGLDLSSTASFQAGFWVACSKIIAAINSTDPKFAAHRRLRALGVDDERKIEQIAVDMKLDVERIAYFAFEAYNQTGETPWKTFDGRDVPRWAGLNDAVRAKWIAAVKAIMVDERRRKEEAVSAAGDAQRACDQAMTALRIAQEQEIGWRRRYEKAAESIQAALPKGLREFKPLGGSGSIDPIQVIGQVLARYVAFVRKVTSTFTEENGTIVVLPQDLVALIKEAHALDGGPDETGFGGAS